MKTFFLACDSCSSYKIQNRRKEFRLVTKKVQAAVTEAMVLVHTVVMKRLILKICQVFFAHLSSLIADHPRNRFCTRRSIPPPRWHTGWCLRSPTL